MGLYPRVLEEPWNSGENQGFLTVPGVPCGVVAAAAAKSLQSCPTLCNPRDGSPPGPRPWDSPGKNTGVGCHFLLQFMKVKSEREVAQLRPTPSDPMDCSLPGSSVHGIFQARVLEWGAIWQGGAKASFFTFHAIFMKKQLFASLSQQFFGSSSFSIFLSR